MIYFYNSRSHKKEKFRPLKRGKVRIYTCGPTVYDYAHIGNFRAYIFEDILRRYLEYRGFRVVQVMNITDVDDKTIRRAGEEGMNFSEFARKYTGAFFEDLDILRIERAEFYPRATEHIGDMVALIKRLKEKEFTYERDDSVYFRIKKFKNYGKLIRLKTEELSPTGRVDADEYQKENIGDFVLWKKEKPREPAWDSEFGRGRPGWHIECSAMSMRYLGESFDIHTGGEDNIFPHHENEIAQSEAATGKRFVNFWLHCRFLLVAGEKMSKSRGNFFTLRGLLKKGFSALAIRYFLLSGHYRNPLNLTEDGLGQAEATVARLRDFLSRLSEARAGSRYHRKLSRSVKKAEADFVRCLDDDLDTPRALAVVFGLVKAVNQAEEAGVLSQRNIKEVKSLFAKFDKVLGIFAGEEAEIPARLKDLIEKREKARGKKDFVLADKIRAELLKEGIILEDTETGTRWKRRRPA